MTSRASIPTYSLRERSSCGVELLRADHHTAGEPTAHAAHRDEHYVLIFQEKGRSRIMVDFEKITVKGTALLTILPGQVHQTLTAEKDTLAWFMALDVSWINDNFRAVFQNSLHQKEPIPLSATALAPLKSCINALRQVYESSATTPFHEHTLRSLTDACISLFAAAYLQQEQPGERTDSRTDIITRQFRSLLQQQFKTMKSPSAYAAALNISPAYLNEVVKQSTGFPVSHWIHQEIILEARRMLYYTDNTVKEIAHLLGYEDHTYFTRLFSKISGLSPLAFRQKYRK
jgi:YesN/AraC family two-component response regulator